MLAIGAGVMALMGSSRGIENLAALPFFLLGQGTRGPATLLQSAVAITCIVLLIGVVRALFAEKKRKLLATEHED